MTEPTGGSGDYWGYLFQENKLPTDKLERLLKGVATCIGSELHPHDSADLTPAQLAAFYRAVGGQYDLLFLKQSSPSIAYIYRSLGCLHSLQPDPLAADRTHVCPSVPALKPSGFVTWQIIQLLLSPNEHVPFLQNALKRFDVKDPSTGQSFPKELPRESFPLNPDQKMIEWQEGVSKRLREDAQREALLGQPPNEQKRSEERRPSTSNAAAGSDVLAIKSDSEDRPAAASYFPNPFAKGRDVQSGVVRSLKTAPQKVMEGGKAVAASTGRTILKMVDPHLWNGEPDRGSRDRDRKRRSTLDGGNGRSSSSSLSSDRDNPHRRDGSATYLHNRSRSPGYAQRGDCGPYSPRMKPRRPPTSRTSSDRAYSHASTPSSSRQRGSIGASSDELADYRHRYDGISSRATFPSIRRHRSQEPPASPRDYFEDWHRPRPHHYQQGPVERPRHRSASHHADTRAVPEIRRTDPSMRHRSESDLSESSSDDSSPPRRNVRFASDFHGPSKPPAMAAGANHRRAPSGNLEPVDPRTQRPSPSEYQPVNERAHARRFSQSNTFPISSNSERSQRPHHYFTPNASPGSQSYRRGSEPSLSPGLESSPQHGGPRDTQQADENRRRHTAGAKSSPMLFGEVRSDDNAAPRTPTTAQPLRPHHSGSGRKPAGAVEGVKGRRYANEMQWPGSLV